MEQYDHEERSSGFPPVQEGPRLVTGVIAAGAAGLVGMAGWYLLIRLTGWEIGYAALGVGALIGIATLKAAREGSVVLGVVAGGFAAVAIVGGQYLWMSGLIDDEVRQIAEDIYTARLAFAHQVCRAQDEEAVRQCIAELNCGENSKPRPSAVTQEEIDSFDDEIRPEFQALADGKPSREEFVDDIVARVRSQIPFTDMVKESVSAWTALWLLLGIGTAYKIASGAKSE